LIARLIAASEGLGWGMCITNGIREIKWILPRAFSSELLVLLMGDHLKMKLIDTHAIITLVVDLLFARDKAVAIRE
jgi:hypothetical protein